MDNALLQFGVGGMFAVFIIREVLNFLKNRQGRSIAVTSGERPVEYWQQQMRQAAIEGFEPTAEKLIAKLDQNNNELRDMRMSTQELNGNINLLLGKLTGNRK